MVTLVTLQVRFKAEIDFDGKAITAAYLEEVDAAALLAEARSLQTEAELKAFLERHGAAVIDTLGAEVGHIGLLKRSFRSDGI